MFLYALIAVGVVVSFDDTYRCSNDGVLSENISLKEKHIFGNKKVILGVSVALGLVVVTILATILFIIAYVCKKMILHKRKITTEISSEELNVLYPPIFTKRNAKMYCVEWNGKRFAMKVLRKELNKSEVVKCLNELEKIKHPNIIPVYGGNYNPPFVVMKFAEQFSLKEYISLSRLEIPRNIKYTILIGIAKGLLYLHQHNILHLNLNPCNVLLDGDLIPYLSDFSTSVFATNYHGSIRDLSVEKARYLSPEQIDGYEVTQKTDVFMFGMVMFFVIEQQSPYCMIEEKIKIYDIKRFHVAPPLQKSNGKEEQTIMKCIGEPEERELIKNVLENLQYNNF